METSFFKLGQCLSVDILILTEKDCAESLAAPGTVTKHLNLMLHGVTP